MEKIIRSICLFSDSHIKCDLQILEKVAQLLQKAHFAIQTKRLCFDHYIPGVEDIFSDQKGILFSMGSLPYEILKNHLDHFFQSKNIAINLDLTKEVIRERHIDLLFKIIQTNASNSFRFTYGFNLPISTPYFPSAKYGKNGFSIGLQPTDLAQNCSTLDQWFNNMKDVWQEIDQLLLPLEGYLGIDSSIAPLFNGKGSFIHFINKLGLDFSHSTTTDIYTTISEFIKKNNPRPTGLCGLMFPCLEDYVLAKEYEKGNFSIERNLFLSLHSGLGIDTYPIGIDQNKTRVLEILKLTQKLSSKFQKPLSVRFVSDGVTKIGNKTNFQNPYLQDIVIHPL